MEHDAWDNKMNGLRLLPIIAVLFTLSIQFAKAQPEKGSLKTAFKYEADFEMYFDNREYNSHSPYPSKTIFGASVSPRIGFSVNSRHSVMAGVEIQKQFGGEFSDILDGISLYYNYDDGRHKLYAGVFPREKMAGKYSRAFFSDSLNFFNQVIQGVLYRYSETIRSGWDINVEAAVDWMGKYSKDERERFMIFSSGKFSKKIFTIGYNAYLYHYACSESVTGVMDNILLYPYLDVDFGVFAGLQSLSLHAGWLQSFQNDRKHGDGYLFPGGAEIGLKIKNWDVSLTNTAYIGSNIMPFYNVADDIGIKYGDDLYFGDRYYSMSGGFYDRLELAYERGFFGFLSVKAALVAHFSKVYCGFQQMLVVKLSF